MAQVGKIIGGAALIAGAIALDVATGGAAFAAGAEEFTAFLAIIGATGASLVASGTEGLLADGPIGHGVSSTNPIKPWDIAYGNVKAPGTIVYTESNGGILSNGSNTYNKCFQLVDIVAAHSIKSIDEVRMDGKAIPLGAGGSGALSTEWTFTPPSNQNQTAISSISRAGGVVTMHLSGSLPNQTGKMLSVQRVHDNNFNGQYTVTQPNPEDASTYTYLCGGPDTSSSGGYVLTCLPDYKNRIHVDRTSCLGKHTSTFPELLSNSTLWTTAHRNLGKASCYIAFYYDQTVFANGIPQISYVIQGKNDIYDPRLGDVTNPAAHVYTTNAALIIADYLTNKTWGFGMEYGTEVPLDALIAAANICDEDVPLAAGGTEARYTINMLFSLNRGRGEVLQDMLGACAGRITEQSGQYIIVPGAWVGPSLSLTQDSLIGPIEYKPYLTVRDACNGVKGTYTSPVSNWQPGDIPPYAEDANHGYDADRWLAADGGERLWKDVSFPATTSCPTAQRLGKIELERLRREGRLTLHCDMSAYRAVALDVIDFSYPRYGWNLKAFEVLSSKLVAQSDANGGAPVLGVDLELAETDSTVCDWSISEEMTPSDTPSPAVDTGQIVLGPQFLELESGPTTAYVGADGVVIPRILAAWLTAPDVAVQSGGYVLVEYQRVGDAGWTPLGTVGGTQTQCYIPNVVSGEQYNVQVQGFSAKGVGSGWAQAGPVTVSATATSFSASSLTYPDGTPVSDLQPAQAGADVTSDQPLAHTGTGAELVSNNDFRFGNIKGWITVQGAAAGYDPDPSIFLPAGTGVCSPTISTIPGQMYRFTWDAWSVGGTQSTYFRINGSSTYLPNIYTDLPYQHDFLVAGSIYVGVVPGQAYTYDWLCPDGVYFVSMLTYNNGNQPLAVGRVSAQDYGAAGEWGIGNGHGTAGTIVDQGDLATVNQADTQHIVAGAVNSKIVATVTDRVTAIGDGSGTILAQATMSTDGGYIKIFCSAYLFCGSNTTATLLVFKGDQNGTNLQPNTSTGINIVGSADGHTVYTAIAVDAAPSLLQQYTVLIRPAIGPTIYCDAVSLIVENAKV